MKISSDLKYRKKENCNNCGLIKLYFSKDVIVTKEAVIKSPVSVMAEIGGYLGMTLGISLLDLETFFNGIEILLKKRKSLLVK